MKCPTDDTRLELSERQGIEIDYCPECRGVWLDRGELDKLIERSATEPSPRSRSEDGEKGRDRDDDRSSKKRKKSSFLGEIFEL